MRAAGSPFNEALRLSRRAAVATVAAFGATILVDCSAALAEARRWRADGVGSLGRFGVLTPDFDPVPESEMWAMAPQGISFHAARFPRDRQKFAEQPNVDEAIDRLAKVGLKAILYAFTTSSYLLDSDGEDQVRAHLEQRSGGIPVILTAQAARAALHSLGSKRIALVHPPWFSDTVNKRGAAYFRDRGFEVLDCRRLEPLRQQFTEVPPDEVFAFVSRNMPKAADALFIGGNGMRVVGAIEALEQRLGRPVLTANQVLLWSALRLVGHTRLVRRYGRIFHK